MAETNRRCDALEKVTPLNKWQLLVHNIFSQGRVTPTKTNKCPLKINGWSRCISYWNGSLLRTHVNLHGGCLVILLLMEEIQPTSWVRLLIPFFTPDFIHPRWFFGFLLWPLPLVYRDWLKPIFLNPYDNQPVNVTTRYRHQVIDGDWKFTQLIPGRWMSLNPYHPWDWYICLHSIHHKNEPNVGK